MRSLNNTWRLVVSGGMIAALAGCGAAKDGATDIKQRVESPQLMKTWQSNCASSQILDLSYRTLVNFSGSNQTEVYRFFQQKDCSVPAIELKYQGGVTLGDAVSPNVNKMDLTFSSVQMKALTPDGQNVLEKVKFCGVQSWPVGTKIDLKGHTGTVTCPIRTVPSGVLDIYSIENNTLFLGFSGLTGGPTVEKDRPTGLDRSQPFTPSNDKI